MISIHRDLSCTDGCDWLHDEDGLIKEQLTTLEKYDLLKKNPSEMKEALPYTLFTLPILFTLFSLFILCKLLYTIWLYELLSKMWGTTTAPVVLKMATKLKTRVRGLGIYYNNNRIRQLVSATYLPAHYLRYADCHHISKVSA